MKRILTFTAAVAMIVPSLFAWGQKGHDVVAEIARRHLTPVTRATLDSLLQNRSIVYWSNWMDNASHTPKFDYSKTWHYKNVDADKTYDSMPEHSKGNVVTALVRQTGILVDPSQTVTERDVALKMVIHLVGDIHQPMHLGHETDLGGNKWKVKFFDTDTQLHGVWDSRLLEAGHKWSYSEWADQIDILPLEKESAWIAGSFDDWGRETYTIASMIYDATPQGSKISYDYIADWTPIVEMQLLKGGLRLAHLLNTIYDPDYNSDIPLKTPTK